MPTLAHIPPLRHFALIGPVLALVGFAVWTLFSLLPALTHPTAPFWIREAWDTAAFLHLGIPLMLLMQVAAGAIGGESNFRQPLWMLGGFFAGLLLVHPSGNDFGLLPLAVILIGAPSYAHCSRLHGSDAGVRACSIGTEAARFACRFFHHLDVPGAPSVEQPRVPTRTSSTIENLRKVA
jgi:hypothetical protein